MPSTVNFTNALLDFQRARRRAAIQSILGYLTGKRQDLLSYEDVRKQLRAIESADRHLMDIPLDAIVGSVNRYTDFSRDFLPKRSINAERWARVKAAAQDMLGLPPIEVYRIGDVYFVQDGNHRVSVARQGNARFIQAYVKEVHSRIPLAPDINASDLIIKAEYTSFLEQTNLDELRPLSNFDTTSPGRYTFILQQLEAIQFHLETEKETSVNYQQATIYWHDQIYLPIIEIIRDRNLLINYPDRTETDLFVWILKNQAEFKKRLGWNVSVESTVKRLGLNFRPSAYWAWDYITKKLMPEKLRRGPATGQWRQQQLSIRKGRLFENIVVVLTDSNPVWGVLNYGLLIAQNEGSGIYGLHITHPKRPVSQDTMERITKKFETLCKQANVPGELVFITSTRIEKTILNRANYASLVILPLTRASSMPRISPGQIVRFCANPVLCIPTVAMPPITRVLLAYDSSPKSNEALFLAAYMAKFWEVSIVVLSVLGRHGVTEKTLFDAHEYLEKYGISGDFIKAEGPPSLAIETFAIEDNCDLIMIGGYGFGIFRKIFAGSLVDNVLRKAQHPILICK